MRQLSDEQWFGGDETSKLGLLDALFLFCYAFGLLFFGSAGDRFNVVYVLVAGMWASAAVAFLFGAGGYIGIHMLPYYAALWGLCGAVQSVGWPANVAVMGNWYRRSERGAVLGIWSGNASAGNIVGTGVAALIYVLVGSVEGWKLSMIVSGAVIFVVGLLCLLFLVRRSGRCATLAVVAAHAGGGGGGGGLAREGAAARDSLFVASTCVVARCPTHRRLGFLMST